DPAPHRPEIRTPGRDRTGAERNHKRAGRAGPWRLDRFRSRFTHDRGGAVLTGAITVPVHRLVDFMAGLFAGAGFDPEAALRAAEALVEADLQGKGSHGVLQAEAYLARLLAGSMSAGDRIEVVTDSGTMLVADAKGILGHLAAEQAMELAIARASEHRLGLVAMRNGFHFGVAGRYALMAARAGCVGLVMCNTRPAIPAPGGAEKLVGTNLLAIALPTAEEPHIVFDIATSAGSV